MLPGVKIEPYYDRSELINVTTETVQREPAGRHGPGHGDPADVPEQRPHCADRGDQYSAGAAVSPSPCCSCGASRRICCRSARWTSASSSIPRSSWSRTSTAIWQSGEHAELPLKQRILRPRTKSTARLFFSTVIMVCAFMPLVHDAGAGRADLRPDGRDLRLRPGGRLVLALTLAPVLCLLFFKNLQADAGQLLGSLMQERLPAAICGVCLQVSLGEPWRSCRLLIGRHGDAAAVPGPRVHARTGGRQPLDPGHVPAEYRRWSGKPRSHDGPAPSWRRYPEVDDVVNQIGRPDDGTDTDGYYNSRVLRAAAARKGLAGRSLTSTGWRSWLYRPEAAAHQGRTDRRHERRAGAQAPRRRLEFLAEHPRQRDGSALGRQGRQLGQDHRPRPRQARDAGRTGQEQSASRSRASRTSASSTSRGKSHLEFRVDPEKCQRWGVQRPT